MAQALTTTEPACQNCGRATAWPVAYCDQCVPLEDADRSGHIYLLHFEQPLAHAQHYIGWTSEGRLFRRLAQHEAGNGASTPLVRAFRARGIQFRLVRTWSGSRSDERALKNRHNARRLCPVCRGEVQ